MTPVAHPLGRNHPTIRHIRDLRRDASARREAGAWIAEGAHLVREALAAGLEIDPVVFAPSLLERADGAALIEQVRLRGIPCAEAGESTVASLQDARSPQPVLAVVRRPLVTLEASLAPALAAPLVVVAHAFQDPGNLGSVVRSAEAAGAHAGYVIGGGVDLLHPRALRGSMGSLFRLPVLAVDAERLWPFLRERGVIALGLDARATTTIYERPLDGALALVLGGEAHGLPAALRERLDAIARIPMHGAVESLSVGAAAAVVLFEAARRRAAIGARTRPDG